MEDCIFCKIVRGEISCTKIFEDEIVLSFLDVAPINPGHALVIPKKHYATLLEIDPEALKACIMVSQKVAKAVLQGVGAAGLNLLQNNFRAGGQHVGHIHFHLIPRNARDGFLTSWPGKACAQGELNRTLEKIKKELQSRGTSLYQG